MKVGARLLAAFFCVALLGAIVAGIGIHNMGKIDTMAGQMYHHELLGLSHIKEANIALIKAGRARSNFLLATTDEDWKEKWNTPPDTAPHFTMAETVPYDKKITILKIDCVYQFGRWYLPINLEIGRASCRERV